MRTLRLILIFALLTLSSAAAQNPPGAGRLGTPNGGITILGRGTAAATPDRAHVSIQVFGNPGPQSASPVSLEDAANALRSALQANGVQDAREVVPIGNLSTRNLAPVVVGTVAKPTRERLEAIARNVVKALPDRLAPALANTQIQVALLVDDCSPDEARAERAAFADARSRAGRIAATAGLRLGGVEAIVATQTFLPTGCETKPDTIDGPATGPPPFPSLYGPLALPITVNETITFAIAGS